MSKKKNDPKNRSNTGKALVLEGSTVDLLAFERFAKGKGFPYAYRVARSIAEARKLLPRK